MNARFPRAMFARLLPAFGRLPEVRSFFLACLAILCSPLFLGPDMVLAAPEGMEKALGLDLAKGVKELPQKDSARAAADPSLRLELKKTAPMAGTIRVGGAVSFEAKLLTDKGAIPPGDFNFRWECDGKAKFLEVEGPPLNTVIFLMPGHFKVRAAAFYDKEGVAEQVALSNPVDVEVSNPIFQLTVSPQKPLVGEEVTAEVRDFPLHEGVEFRWAPLSRNARLVRVGEKDVSFYVSDDQPVTVSVSASMPQAGVTLGEARAVVKARPYEVEVKNLGITGEKTVVWIDGQGPAQTDAIAVRREVRLRADVSPSPGNPPLTYKWTAQDGSSLAGSDASREAAAFRESVGECNVSVEVRDSRGLVIGRGEGAFPVSVSQAELDKAEINARETLRLAAEAEKLWSLGQVDESLAAAEAARNLNPKHPEAVRVEERIGADARRIRDILKRGEESLAVDDFRQTTEALDEAGKINGQYPALANLEKRMQERKAVLARIDALIEQGGRLWDGGDVAGALAVLDKALALDELHEAARTERERMVKGRDRIIAALKEADALLTKKQFESAAAAIKEVAGINENFKPLKELKSRIDERRNKAWKVDELLARAQDQWNGGDVDAALAALGEVLAIEPRHPGAADALKKMAKLRDALRGTIDKADALAAKGDQDGALAMIAKARKLNPKYYPAIKAEQELNDRRSRAEKVRALTAESAKRWADGDVEGSLRAVDEALALDPGNAALKDRRAKLGRAGELVAESLRRARGLLDDKLFDKAMRALDDAAAVNSRNPQVAELRKTVEQAAKNAQAQTGELLAKAKKRLDAGDFQAALDLAEEVRERPGLDEKRAALAASYAKAARSGLEKMRLAEKTKAATVKKEQAKGDAARRKKECDGLFKSAEVRRSANEHAEAIRDYQKVLNVCPDYCTAYNNIGASLYKLGYAKESLPWFEEAAKCDPEDRLFSDNAALTRKLAVGKGESASGADPAQCAEVFRQAEASMAAKDHRQAVKLFREAARLCPDNCAAYNNVGLSLNRLGYVKESLPWFEQAQKCDPRDTLFKENVGIANKQLKTAKKDAARK